MEHMKEKEHQEILPNSRKLLTDVQSVLAQLQLPEGAKCEVTMDDSGEFIGRVCVNLRIDLDPKKPHANIQTIKMAQEKEDWVDQEFDMLWLQVNDALRRIGVSMDGSAFEAFKRTDKGVKTNAFPLTEGLTRQLSGRIAKLFGKE